ncbi:uncharacterized protein LOC118732355 [Rhagoletis pomonella]|uniref:uncharacterized protein LOC118732355 n=1 Tax=Rhagoletis pomonella TaxID=28610 RepID=UPI001781A198|nr:uncharacterized protein LOC118732355 [Rhagoletis pomonella]
MVITDADKGNKTVAMYGSEYIEKINKLLEDKNTYKTSRTDPTSTLQRKNNKIVDELYKAKHINKREKQLLTSTAAAAPRLYGLPKIHKPQVPLRPIASSVKVPCYKLSKYVGEILKPLISERYNVKNAFNLKERLTNISVCDEDVLVSFDVISLFTNIPTMLATKIIMIKWDQIQRTTSIPKHKFQQILDFCLKDNNYFMCNNKLYTQTFGMPMGNPLSPTIADIIMDDLLDNTISELKQHFNIDIKFINKYVDDIFAITNRNDVNTILETLNKYHPKLQFTMEMEENASIPFLDVRIHKNNNNIVLNWYSKPTSSGRLINYLSSQPRKYKINTAKNLIHKILTISDQKFHEANIEKIHSILKSNNYPNHLIRELIKQETMRIGNQQNKTPTTATANTPKKYYSVTYIPKLSENFDRSTLKEQNITLAYKTNNTLARIYTRTKSPLDKQQQNNVVYEIKCKGKENENCGKVYIGTTKRTLGVRIAEHQTDIRKQKHSTALSQHILNSGHTADFTNTRIIDKEKREMTRYTLESLRILEKRENTINKKEDTDNIAAAYMLCISK